MKKYLMSFAAVAAMLLMAACGNKSANTTNDNAEAEEAAAPIEVTYDDFTVEKYGASVDVPQGMRRTDTPVMDNGGCWSFVPEDADDFPIDAAVQFSVNETYFGDYTKEKVEQYFNEDIPEDATTKELGDMEYTYSVEGEYINEYHRVMYKGNLCADVTVAYTEKYADKLGGDIRDHILQSMTWK